MAPASDILGLTFLVFPALGLLLANVAPGLLTPELWTGLLFLCTLPSTVQSSIAFTSIAGGNVAGTVASAAISNLLGIGLTPIFVGILIRPESSRDLSPGMVPILLQLLLPFAFGHLMRPWIGRWVARRKAFLSMTDRGTIVVAVYGAFSAAVVDRLWVKIPPSTLAILVGLTTLLLLAILLISRTFARLAGFDRQDEISVVFCGSKKSLVSGIPMARVLFAAPHAGAVILPLMIFHQIQLIVCAWLARRYARKAMPSNSQPS